MGADEAVAIRIAVLLQSLEGGGAQRRVVDLVNEFIRAGREVDLLLVELRGELRDRISPAARLFELRPSGLSLSKYLEREVPDALLVSGSQIHDLAVNAMAHARPMPLILRADSHPFRTFPWSMPRQRLREPLRRRARLRRYAAADLIIAVAADVASAIQDALPAARIMVTHDPIVTASFIASADSQVSFPWPDDPGIPLIVSVGRFALAKDYPTLLRAFALLRSARPARLAIIGDGSPRERQALVRLARKLGIESDLALPGRSDAVAAWLTHAALFVSSSLWEGVAGAMIEALAVGCPVVATSAGGTARELLTDGQLGAIVPPSDPAAMADAMAAQLDKSRDKSRLIAAADPYRPNGQASEYLTAIDECVRTFRRGRSDVCAATEASFGRTAPIES